MIVSLWEEYWWHQKWWRVKLVTFFNPEIFDLDLRRKVRFAFLANFVLKAWQDALPMYFWSKNHNCLLKWIDIHRISGWFCVGGKSNQVYRYLTPTQNIDIVKRGASTYDDGAVFVWDIQTACRIGWQEFLWIDFIFQILFCCFFICCLNISCDRLEQILFRWPTDRFMENSSIDFNFLVMN